jgi:rhamnulokinase
LYPNKCYFYSKRKKQISDYVSGFMTFGDQEWIRMGGSALHHVIAIDLGASSGRLIHIQHQDEKILMEEIYRFENGGISIDDHLHWDIQYIYCQVLTGLQKAFREVPAIDAIGIDTWGVDFGLLDGEGKLIGSPFHYRDAQTKGMITLANSLLGEKTLFQHTGVQDMWFNTVYQLLGMQQRKASCLHAAENLLMMPDLLGFMLTGNRAAEYTSASTTQLYRIADRCWDNDIIQALGLRGDIFPQVADTGSIKGILLPEIQHKLQCGSVPLVATAQHDSASAAYAVPAQAEDYLFINSGTWSVLGVVTDQPIMSDSVWELGLSNEGAAYGRTKLVKSIMGMWLTQECRREWRKKNINDSFAFLAAEVEKSEPFRSIVDCESELFVAPGNMPEAIDTFCIRTGQPHPRTQGEYIRCITESLALMYHHTIQGLESVIGKRFSHIHLLGGASQDRNFCRFIADATGKKVIAGPVEATALGNGLIQLKSLGSLSNKIPVGSIISGSFPLYEYLPVHTEIWDERYRWFQNVILPNRKGKC